MALQTQLPPLRVSIYDASNAFQCSLGDYRSISVVQRFAASGTGSLTVDVTHPRFGVLIAEGARIVVDYFIGSGRDDYADDDMWMRLLNGRFTSVNAVGPEGSDYAEFQYVDDGDVLARVLAWPVPTASISAQTSEYDEQTGAAETVAKHYITANVVDRLGLPYRVAADQARGGTLTCSARFDTLDDLLTDALDELGLDFTFVQADDGVIDVELRVPTDRSDTVVFGAPYGNLSAWTMLRSDPTGTRAVVLGSGDGTDQVLATVVDPEGEETAWGTVFEVAVDDTSDDTTAALQTYGTTELATMVSTVGVDVDVVETPGIQFGRAYQVGDTIGVAVNDSLTITDRVTSVTVGWSVDDGLEVSPVIGDATETQEPAAAVAAAIGRLGAAMRRVRTR